MLAKNTLQRDLKEVPRNEGRKVLRQLRDMLFSEDIRVRIKDGLNSTRVTGDLIHSEPFRIEYDLDGVVGMNTSKDPERLFRPVHLKESDFRRELAKLIKGRKSQGVAAAPAEAFLQFLEEEMRKGEARKKMDWWEIARKEPFNVNWEIFTDVWKTADSNHPEWGLRKGGRPKKP